LLEKVKYLISDFGLRIADSEIKETFTVHGFPTDNGQRTTDFKEEKVQ